MSSLSALTLTLLFYSFIGLQSTVCATELDQRIPPDHNHPIIDGFLTEGSDGIFAEQLLMGEIVQQWLSDEKSVQDGLETLAKRAPEGVSTLVNNGPQNINVDPGVTQTWLFPKDAIQGPHGVQGVGFPSDASITGNMSDEGSYQNMRKRQASTQIWITINTCLQPDPVSDADAIPPQLQLYVSNSADDETPGPSTSATQVDVEGGFGIIQIEASDDVYIGVSAPNTTDFTGSWNYEIAASIDAPFHFYSNQTDLQIVDSDNHAALLITPNVYNSSNGTTYDDWMKLTPPFGMFAHDQQRSSILGVSRSYCGLRHNAKVSVNVPDAENNNVASTLR